MPVSYAPAKPWSGRFDPEDGENVHRFHQFESLNGKHGILGFKCDAGVKRNKGRIGAKEGPGAIRQALCNLAVPETMSSFKDLGDIDVTEDDLETGQNLLAHHIDNALETHNRLIILGGGHETAWGSYQGLAKHYPGKKIGIINLDAHLDLRNIGEDGPSSGTPFNQIRQFSPENFDYLCIGIAEEANTNALFERARNWNVDIIKDTDLISDIKAADHKIDQIIERSDLIYLTIDIDLLSHFQAPGVSAPAARGVSLAIVEYLLEYIFRSAKTANRPIPLMDIVEVSPKYDRDNMTAKTAALLARKYFCR
jgi:formiminoglutamase